VRADEGLDLARDGEAVLRHLILQSERLPAVRVSHHRPWLIHTQRLIGRLIRRVDVALLFERPVTGPGVDDRRCDPVAEGGGTVPLRVREVRAIAERRHRLGELGGGLG
jgi:hypothetical protein